MQKGARSQLTRAQLLWASSLGFAPPPCPGVSADISELDAGSVGNVTFPEPDNLMKMRLTVRPDKGLWAGAPFEFSIEVGGDYPHKAPQVKCLTRIYHPNIDLAGNVCLNILRDGWKPVLDINCVIYGLIFLFYEPNAKCVRARERCRALAFPHLDTPAPWYRRASPVRVHQLARRLPAPACPRSAATP